MPRPSPLRALADRVGIVSEYLDQTGSAVRRTSDATRIAILRAMGIAAATTREAEAALAALDAQDAARLLEPVRVVPLRRARSMRLGLTLPERLRGQPVRWELQLLEEQGRRRTTRGRTRASRAQTLSIPIPAVRETGYHRLTLRLFGAADEDGEASEAEQSLIVVPSSCPAPRQRLGGRRVMGIIANLYTLRSARNWGVGDLEDLARLLVWSGAIGAEFVGVNPLHALRNRGIDVSPYSPVSRIYRNPIYIDPASVPELAESAVARDLIASTDVQRELDGLRTGDRVEYARVWTIKRAALRALHATFATMHRGRETERGRRYAAWCRIEGDRIVQFATFMALDEHFTREGQDGGFRSWPKAFGNPASRAVREFVESHPEEIDFHCWVQYELDCQVAAAAERGVRAGLDLGLYQDLAIGTSPSGSDVWSFPDLFVQGASIGAPPDPYSATGQNWGLPPIDPRKLREDGYRYWITLVRASLRHAGALRIDHVMGLFRQFWIPDGMSGTEGAYVEFPADDLLGVLALESTRAGALVVGEDLGTVPPEVPPALARWGILSSKVLYFERDERGRFLPAAHYSARSLATANTHDMPTIAGFWSGRDIELREQVGLCDADQAREERRQRRREREQLVARFVAEGALPDTDDSDEPDEQRVRAAAHAFLCGTPAVLVGLALDDLGGETDPVNVPGVGPDKYPSWTRRMRLSLEEIAFDADVAAGLRCGARERRTRRPARAKAKRGKPGRKRS
jgi:4-alpha-glucanotransferase